MPLNQLPDFSYKGEVPTAAIIQAYQNKVAQEQDMQLKAEAAKNEKVNQVAQMFKSGASLVTQLVDADKQKQILTAQQAVGSLLKSGSDQVPVGSGPGMTRLNKPVNGGQGPSYSTSIPTAQTADYSTTPEYKAQLASLLTKAYPKEAGEELSKNAFKSLYPDAAGPKVGQFATASIRLPGQSDPITVTVDKINHKVFDLGGNDITEQAGGALTGYAPATVTTNEGVNMVPRQAGSYTATSETPKPGKLINNINQLAPRHTEILEKTKEDFNSDKSVSAALTKQSDLEMAQASIETGNWVGDATILSNIAKGLGRDVGNLAEPEQARYKASPELVRNVKTKVNKWVKGVIPEEDRADFIEAIRVAREKNTSLLKANRIRYGNLARKRVPGLDPAFAQDYMYSFDTEDSTQSPAGLPKVGGTFNGGVVRSIKRID